MTARQARVVVAHDFTIRNGQATIARPVTFALPPERPLAVLGSKGSGRSALLLGLTGRMRGTAGELTVLGEDAIRHPRRVQRLTGVARIGGYVDLEDRLTVEDSVVERTLFDAAKPAERHANVLRAARLVGLHRPGDPGVGVPGDRLVGDLSPLEQTQLALALACVRDTRLVVLDDAERDLSLAEQRTLWAGIAALSAAGTTVVAATRERAAIPPTAAVVDLDPQER